MNAYGWYVLAALAEIGGCFAFWATIRRGHAAWTPLLGLVLLAAFAIALTKVDAPHAGRAYAAYGGVYILTSLAWLWGVERVAPDRWDLAGALVCVVGSAIILYGPRSG